MAVLFPPLRSRLAFAKQVRQLRNIHRNPPRLVFGEQFRRRPQLRLVLVIDIREPSRFDTY
jgi:hypothetical protein